MANLDNYSNKILLFLSQELDGSMLVCKKVLKIEKLEQVLLRPFQCLLRFNILAKVKV